MGFPSFDLGDIIPIELILPLAAEKPQQAERCESFCWAEILPVGGREAEQVMAALT